MGDFDIKNLIMAMLMCFLIIIGWRLWQEKNSPPPRPPAPQKNTQPAASSPAKAKSDKTPTAENIEQVAGRWYVEKATRSAEEIILGSKVEDNAYMAEIRFNPQTAGIATVLLSEHRLLVDDEETGYPLLAPGLDGDNHLYSFTQGKLQITGRDEKFDMSRACWKTAGVTNEGDAQSVAFTAMIADAKGINVLEITKSFRYRQGAYELEFQLSFDNKTHQGMEIELEMTGPVGIRREDPRTDRRQTLACFVDGDGKVTLEKEEPGMAKEEERKLTVAKPDEGNPIIWFANGNKFFTTVIRPLPLEGEKSVDFIKGRDVDTYLYPISKEDQKADPAIVKFDRYTAVGYGLAPAEALAAKERTEFNFVLYLGPIDTDSFEKDEAYAGLHFDQLLNTYACTLCTFSWLTTLLLKTMGGIYSVVNNYGIAIIILVLIVRLILHPLTKKGQVSMMKMSKGMTKLQPKIEEIRKKHAGNNAEIQKATMALYKESGVNPASGCLGILPMFIQMPIWVALFTAVDANVALRHEGLLPVSWHWITDLSSPDRLVPLAWLGIDEAIKIPLLYNMIGGIDAFNLLPILLCFAMFLQMKYTTAATPPSANPQMAQQQKIMKVLMPVMMLLFFYTAPSGLNLYIMGSTFGGLLEQHFIRKHIKDKEEKEAAVTVAATSKISSKFGDKKKKPKPPVRYN